MPANIDFVDYADENTLYLYSSNIEYVLHNLQGSLEKMFHWFSTNHYVANMNFKQALKRPQINIFLILGF